MSRDLFKKYLLLAEHNPVEAATKIMKLESELNSLKKMSLNDIGKQPLSRLTNGMKKYEEV